MIFWVFTIVMTAAVLYVLARPLLAKTSEADAAPETAAYDVAVFKSQLREVERDLERGRLSAEEAEASRIEIGRRLLAADKELQQSGKVARVTSGPVGKLLALGILGGAVVLAVFLYFRTGDPSAPDMPLVLRKAELAMAQGRAGSGNTAAQAGQPAGAANPEAGDVNEMADRLRARLDSGEGSPTDWVLLGRTEMLRGNFAEAADAFKTALKSFPNDVSLNASYGEALVFWADGLVTEDAVAVFDKVLDMEPRDPRANFYRAEYDWAKGDKAAALDRLITLVNTAEPDAPWVDMVVQRANDLAHEAGIDIAGRIKAPGPAPSAAAEPPPGPSAADIAAAQNMSKEDQQAMAESMVDRLAERLAKNPSDFDGWIRLIKARGVLGDTEGAQAALDQAAKQFANAPFPLRKLAQIAAEEGLTPPGGGTTAGASSTGPRGPSAEDMAAAQDMSEEDRKAMIEGMVSQLADRLKDNPNDLQGWTMLGRSYSVLGRTEDALLALEKASALDPTNTDLLLERARLMRQIAGDAQTPETVSLMAQVEAQNPNSLEALWFLGLDRFRQGDRAAAQGYFDRAIAQLPEGSGERASLQAEIDRLFKGG